MRLTRAAPAGTTSSSTPPISRIVAPGIGASNASTPLRASVFRATGLRAVLRARGFTAVRPLAVLAFFVLLAFFAFFAMRELVAQFARGFRRRFFFAYRVT